MYSNGGQHDAPRFDPSAVDWDQFPAAAAGELSSRNRLMPPRWDYGALATRIEPLEEWLRPQIKRGPTGNSASIVFANKESHGTRPLHVMFLTDRILYRLLVSRLAKQLPERFSSRPAIGDFRRRPLAVSGVRYVVTSDVTSYYEYIDHELLRSDLLDQTGDQLATESLTTLLSSVMSRAIGLPQVHPSSDVLGDTYIDPVRRGLMRNGYASFTYSDDLRIAVGSLGEARAALEACQAAVRERGLVLNDRKTFTFGRDKYEQSLNEYSQAEERLFTSGTPTDPFDLGSLDSEYADGSVGVSAPFLGVMPIEGPEEDDVLQDPTTQETGQGDDQRIRAAERAWQIWAQGESQSTPQEAAITRSLIGRALPALAISRDTRPLDELTRLLTFEPSLTPNVSRYLIELANGGPQSRTRVRAALDAITSLSLLSPWQEMWLADVAGSIRRAKRVHGYEIWLHNRLESRSQALAATAAAALGRIGRVDSVAIARCIDKVGPVWRTLAFWGLARVDPQLAEEIAEDRVDRIILESMAGQ